MNEILRRAITQSRIVKKDPPLTTEKIGLIEGQLFALTARVLELENQLYEMQKRNGFNWEFTNIPMTTIIRLVSKRTGVHVRDIKSDRRSARVALARHIFMYVARHMTGFSLPTIGRFMNKDHTTIMHGIERIELQRKTDLPLDAMLIEIFETLKSGCEGPELAREPGFEPGSHGFGDQHVTVTPLR